MSKYKSECPAFIETHHSHRHSSAEDLNFYHKENQKDIEEMKGWIKDPDCDKDLKEQFKNDIEDKKKYLEQLKALIFLKWIKNNT